MKVFISHSSAEKWAARKIAEDIHRVGAETFLDEKDIASGDAIDHSIHTNLVDCDHFLLVLSPASLRSHWVLVELGGALALKKVIVPILMYIGPNEVPDPIKRLLARDINDIDKYYDQLRRQLTSGQSPKPSKPRPQRTRQTSFKVGDKVRIPEAGGDRVQEIVWNPDGEMNKFLGREATVTRLYSNFGARLDIDDGQFVWAFDWLRPSPKASRGRAAG